MCVCAMSSKHTRSFIKMKRSAFLLGHSNIRINCMTNTEIAFGNVVNGDKSDINMRPLLFQSVSSWWRVAQQHLYLKLELAIFWSGCLLSFWLNESVYWREREQEDHAMRDRTVIYTELHGVESPTKWTKSYRWETSKSHLWWEGVRK